MLIPLNLVFGICLAAGGVISNFQPAQKAELVEPVAVQPNADGGWSVIDGAQIEGDTVKVDGKVVEGARVVTEQFLPQGPAAQLRLPSNSPAPTAAASLARTLPIRMRTPVPSPTSSR